MMVSTNKIYHNEHTDPVTVITGVGICGHWVLQMTQFDEIKEPPCRGKVR